MIVPDSESFIVKSDEDFRKDLLKGQPLDNRWQARAQKLPPEELALEFADDIQLLIECE